MLSNIRDNSSGVLAWGIAILIIIAMAFFGLSSYVGNEPAPVVAEVGDRSINQYQFRGEFSAWQNQMRQRLGQNATLDLNSDEFKQRALDSMINREIVAELVEKNNYTIGDESLANEIRNNPQFQSDGKFDQEIYDRFVASNASSKSDYENSVRLNVASRHVLTGFSDSSFTLNNTLNELAQLQSQERTFDVAALRLSDLEKDIELTDDQIKAYYDDNIESYQEDERVSVEYVRMSAKAIESEVNVSDEDLQLAYEENKENYLTDETRNVRHILFTGDDAKEDSTKAYEQLRSGADFALLAKELSQDPGSAVNGGDLGVVERGQMVPSFDKRAFELEANVVSEPVLSRFGYHVLEVTKINTPEIPSFEDAKEDIRSEQVNAKAEEIFFDRVDQLKNIVFENPSSLQAAADELNLTVETSSLFSRLSGKGVAQNVLVRDAAFSPNVLLENTNSDVIEISPTDVIALRKKERIGQQAKKLDEVKAQISKALKTVKAKEIAAKKSEEIFDQIKTSGWSEAVQAENLTIEEQSASYASPPSGLDRGLLDKVFAASLKDESNKTGRVEGGNGDYYLYQLKSVDKTDSVEKDVSDSLERMLTRENGSALVGKFLLDQREKLGVKVDASAF